MENFALSIDVIRGVNLSNKIPNALYAYIIDQIIKFTKAEANNFDKEKIIEMCSTEASDLKESEVEAFLDSFVNISRYGAKKGLSGKNIQSFLKDNTLIDEQKMILFVTQFTQQITDQNIVKMISLGKLLNLRWNVCSFLTDSKTKDLNKIFISIELVVQTANGEVLTDEFILSLPEFKAFKEVISQTYEVSQQYHRE